MERRQIRAFTLDARVSKDIDEIIEQGPNGALAKSLFTSSDVFDSHSLREADYEALYEKLPKTTPDTKLPRELRYNIFMIHLQFCSEHYPHIVTGMLREVNARIKANRQKAAPPLNGSRVADALIKLGLEVLRERVQALEVSKGSPRRDVGQGEDKLPVSRRRKGAAV